MVSLISAAVRKTVFNKRAQFVLPAVLLVPIVLLVIYLIFETAKLSREKIRQQFALDSAAFVELQPAVTYLNATSYINAAFPYRIFRENMSTPIKADIHRGGGEDLTVYDWFYRAGAFPGAADKNNADAYQPKDSDQEWNLRYAEGTRTDWEKEDPVPAGDSEVVLTDPEISDKYFVGMDLLIENLYLYSIVYGILGDTFENQGKIYDKISKDGMFFKKSYYLNTGTCKESECGKEGARAFQDVGVKILPFTIKNLKLNHAYLHIAGQTTYHGGKEPNPVVIKASTIAGEGRDSLFQFGYLDSSSRRVLRKLRSGIDVEQSFTPPANYFNVDLKRYKPRVHVKVYLQCPAGSNNCVWPRSTPKYQLRMTP
ncbi:hypothetical protein Emin_1195 [Elusimicrobium minutum Pei191]|uniref:Uncharacterized protein n=1 Tax=Elusimicrobium minutum (strain Pei191) TaxID=445932 RepID=B2KDZ9_ELUMP|nr:hypothetical protein [Elusimicrobium minutum]ACC98745.1 hypothetical protein Emin_1195 [Elusimicrobium minutum Pei191]